VYYYYADIALIIDTRPYLTCTTPYWNGGYAVYCGDRPVTQKADTHSPIQLGEVCALSGQYLALKDGPSMHLLCKEVRDDSVAKIK